MKDIKLPYLIWTSLCIEFCDKHRKEFMKFVESIINEKEENKK